jgi:LmbE family N-acetylglucosaminyl deacetylase
MTIGTLLGVWANPDAEAHLAAGLMAPARSRCDPIVVTATAGEDGTDDPERLLPHWLPACRRKELAAPLAVVAVDEHHVLGYPDGACPDQRRHNYRLPGPPAVIGRLTSGSRTMPVIVGDGVEGVGWRLDAAIP